LERQKVAPNKRDFALGLTPLIQREFFAVLRGCFLESSQKINKSGSAENFMTGGESRYLSRCKQPAAI
jgi:hypothetical protein